MTSLLYLIKNRKSEDTILRICVFSLKKKKKNKLYAKIKGLIFPLWNEGGRSINILIYAYYTMSFI